MADWVELRVHGVSGTPPDYKLSSAHTRQVAGDDRSRCFRPTDAQGREERAPDAHLVEAFHWGQRGAAADRRRWLSLYRDTDPVAGPVTSWDHTPDGGPLRSRRLEDPGNLRPDSVDADTGRRECGSEWRLLAPVPGDLALQTRALTGLGGHSGYWLDPDWGRALATVRGG